MSTDASSSQRERIRLMLLKTWLLHKSPARINIQRQSQRQRMKSTNQQIDKRFTCEGRHGRIVWIGYPNIWRPWPGEECPWVAAASSWTPSEAKRGTSAAAGPILHRPEPDQMSDADPPGCPSWPDCRSLCPCLCPCLCLCLWKKRAPGRWGPAMKPATTAGRAGTPVASHSAAATTDSVDTHHAPLDHIIS